jgi:hypothetical protein
MWAQALQFGGERLSQLSTRNAYMATQTTPALWLQHHEPRNAEGVASALLECGRLARRQVSVLEHG